MATSGIAAQIVTGTPNWSDGMFRQTFKVSAPLPIPPEVFERCVAKSHQVFRGVLAMNGYNPGDYAWPPNVLSDTANDMLTSEITLVVFAKRPPDFEPPPGAAIN